jgi:hypothetical protein
MMVLGQSTRMGGHVMKVRIISILVAFVFLFGPVVFVDGKGKGGGGSRGTGGAGSKNRLEQKSRGGGKEGAKVNDAKAVKAKTASQGQSKAGGPANAKDPKPAKVKAVGKGKALGKDHQMQLAALKRQGIHEQQKHLKRSARLGRIRLLAVEAGNARMIARIDKLILREQGRYVSKSGRMDKKKNVIMGIAVDPKIPVEGEVKVKIKAVP